MILSSVNLKETLTVAGLTLTGDLQHLMLSYQLRITGSQTQSGLHVPQ